MKRRFWQQWTIGTRVMLIAMLPVAYLFASIVWYSWHSHQQQVTDELAERGRIVSRALAQSSEYNLISGNLADLRTTIDSLVQSDSSIYRIEVVDANRATVVGVQSETARRAEERVFEAPIHKQTVWLNLFRDQGAPHVTGAGDTRPPTMTSEVVGYIRVTMSPSHMTARQLVRFQVELGMAALALVVSGVLAWILGRKLTIPLRASIGALREVRGGNYQARLPVTTGGEVGELQASISEMSAALERATQHLENQVEERTRELVESRNEALRADADKRKLIQKVNSIVEDERKGIAVEIHDELNAALIAVRLESQGIAQLAAKAAPAPELDAIRAKAEHITKLALDLYASGRRLVRRLRPEVLDMLGLHGAVEEMIRHYNNGECHFTFEAAGDFSRLGNELAISAYRIVQETLSNIMKHAGAHHADVVLALDDATLSITVTDDGSGFVPESASEGIGIIGMRERVAAVQGTIEIESAPGKGSRIHITLPLDVS
jgi:two-component system sensor histidine kinase UhpB